MNRAIVLTLALLVVQGARSPLVAQGCTHAAEDAGEHLENLRSTFYSDDPADVASRGDAIQILSPTDSAYVVQDSATCDRVIGRAIGYMRDNDSTWAAGREGDYEATVYRLGPYVVVVISAEDPPATYINGVLSFDPEAHGKAIVFRARGLKIVRVFR